jgi:Tfp pilus assembly protein PilF
MDPPQSAATQAPASAQPAQAEAQRSATDIVRLRKEQEAHPEDNDKREALAEAYVRAADLRRAIEEYTILRKHAPERFRYLLNLAQLYEKSGSRETANAYYLLASRSPDPDVAEKGHLGLGNRYPYGPEFERALQLEPSQQEVRRELGYLYIQLKQPEPAARHFEIVVRNEPRDYQSLMQLADLYTQLGRKEDALRMLKRVQREGSPKAREELAGSFLRKGEPKKALDQYLTLRRQEPLQHRHLLSLAQIYEKLNEPSTANAYYLLASRAPDAQVAAAARLKLGSRYPFPAEFEEALQLEPDQHEVRRELGYLYITIHQPAAAARHFERIVQAEPKDYQSVVQLGFLYADLLDRRSDALPLLESVVRTGPLDQALKAAVALQRLGYTGPPGDDPPAKIFRHKLLGFVSISKSYLPAAAREFEAVHELDPHDYQAIMQLGYLYSTMKRNDVAKKWFRLGRSSPDQKVAAESRRALFNVSWADRKVITTVWAMPFATTRWETLFGYGQMKTEYNIKGLPFRPYLSMRFVGDTNTRTTGPGHQIRSDESIVFGAGLLAKVAKNMWAWGEAGNAVSFLGKDRPRGIQRSEPDYRAGLSYGRVVGPTLYSKKPGFFLDVTNDAVYLSRFAQNVLFVNQTKIGYQLPTFHGFYHQPMLATTTVADARGDYVANYVEFGPAYRFGFIKFSRVYVYAGAFRGAFTTQGRRYHNYLHRPNYTDFRLAVWYAKSF